MGIVYHVPAGKEEAMPLYEYVCDGCDSRFERLQPMSAAHVTGCPDCGEEAKRVLSLFAAPVAVGAGAGPSPVGPLSGGACCGGACGCG